MRRTVTENIFLHVARLRSGGSRRNAGTRAKLTHKDTVTVTFDIGDWVQNTIDTHTDADVVAQIFNMNIGSAEFVSLVQKKIEDLVSTNGIQGLRNRGNRFRVTLAGNFDIVIMHLFRRIIAQHHSLIATIRNQEEVDTVAINIKTVSEFFDSTTWGLRGDKKLIRLPSPTFLQRQNVVAMHFGNIN